MDAFCVSDLVDFFLATSASCRLRLQDQELAGNVSGGYLLLVFNLQAVANKNRCWNLMRGGTLPGVLLISFGQPSMDFSRVTG